MAEEGDVLTDLNPPSNGNGADTAPVAGIITQYVKDLSVENPRAPDSFGWTDAPELDVQFNIAARRDQRRSAGSDAQGLGHAPR